MSADTPQTFSPSAFIEAVTDAVLPLVDGRDGARLIEGKSLYDVRCALLRLFGEYTVEDSVHVHRMLKHADGHWRRRTNGDDPRAHAIYEAREVLVHFICHAQSSGPACAAARAAFAMAGDGDDDGSTLLIELHRSLHFHICGDIQDLRSNNFGGKQYFVDELWAHDLRMEALRETVTSDNDGGDHAA